MARPHPSHLRRGPATNQAEDTEMLMIECSECGQKVVVPPAEVALWKRPDGCNLLRFTCPACGRGTGGCLQRDDLELLRSEGVTGIDVPAEALESHDGPPLTLDDLIDLHFLLESDGWERRLAQTTGVGRVRRLARARSSRRTATGRIREDEP